MSFQDLLDKHGKRCSHCGSDQLTSLNSKLLRHRCLDCGLWMYEDEVVVGKEAGEKVAEAYRKKLAEEAPEGRVKG